MLRRLMLRRLVLRRLVLRRLVLRRLVLRRLVLRRLVLRRLVLRRLVLHMAGLRAGPTTPWRALSPSVRARLQPSRPRPPEPGHDRFSVIPGRQIRVVSPAHQANVAGRSIAAARPRHHMMELDPLS